MSSKLAFDVIKLGSKRKKLQHGKGMNDREKNY